MQGVVFVGWAEVDVDVAVAFARPVPLRVVVVTEPWRMICDELDITLVADAETFPAPIEVATFEIDPNTPDVVETVIVEEYET